MLRFFGFLACLHRGKQFLADLGYVGIAEALVPYKRGFFTLTVHHRKLNCILGSVRVLVEHTIGSIKRFETLCQPFWHALYLHEVVFRVCAQLVAVDQTMHPTQHEQVNGNNRYVAIATGEN